MLNVGTFIIGGICAKHWGGPVRVPIRPDQPLKVPHALPISRPRRPSQ